ncbi:hypothetical protein GCM10009776_08080 [Microbacterium deminutum]|uniref:Uncharacterized protein n=1 Tax=Microbacterium deminutum TaxID=344164 RepID=A0ABP5BM22_9MICO
MVGRCASHLVNMDADNNLSLELWGLEKLLDINELAAYRRLSLDRRALG